MQKSILLIGILSVILILPFSCATAPAAEQKSAAADTTPPVVTVLSPTNGQEVGSNHTIYGTVSDDSSGVDKLYLQVEANAYVEIAVSNGYWTTNVCHAVCGQKTNQVYATDKAGNASSPVMVLPNRQPIPFVTITNISFGQIISNARYQTKGTCGIDLPSLVTNVYLYVITNNATNIYTDATSASDNWKDWLDLQPNTNWIFANAVGNNGKSNYSAPMLLVRDAVAPVPGNSGTLSVSSLQETSFGLSWTKANDNYSLQSDLMYRVDVANTSNSATNYSQSWSVDASSIPVFGLTVGMNYNVYLSVRDNVGNISHYSTLSQTMPDQTPPLPTNQGTIIGPITIANVSSNSFQMIWERANDNLTPKDQVLYLAVWSYASNLNNVAQAEANGVPFYGWSSNSQNIITNTLTGGLLSETTYYVNVIAKDLAGNKSVYTINFAKTTGVDGPYPVPGNSGIIAFADSGTNVIVSWTKASDVNTPQANLQYRAYYSISANISTVADMQANGTELTSGWTTDIGTITHHYVPAYGSYNYNVMVRDASGNTTNYAMNNHYHM